MKINQTISSDARLRVEAALKEATGPLSAQAISDLSGISISLTRTHLGNAIHKGRARNINPKRNGALYLWGAAALPELTAGLPRFMVGTYAGEKPIAIRPGSMEAYELPSMERGQSIERKRPLIVGGRYDR